MGERLQVLSGLVDSALELGALGAEALLEDGRGFEAEAHRGKVVSRRPTHSALLTVRCWLAGGRLGMATGDPSRHQGILRDALQAAETGAVDPSGGPIDRVPAIATGLGIDDRRHASIDESDRLDVLISTERAARGVDRRIGTGPFKYWDRRTWRGFVSSRRVTRESWGTTYSIQGSVHIASGSGELGVSGGIDGRSFASVASIPFGVGLARRLVSLVDAETTDLSGDVLVMLPPHLVADLFMVLTPVFEAECVRPGSTFLGRGSQAGALAVDHRLHLVDDGALPGGLRSRAFDDRGVPPVPVMILREGRLEGRFVDPASARGAGERPTGHWLGDRMRVSNLQLRSGTRSMNAVTSELTEPVLFLDHIEGVERCVDLQTGRLEGIGSGMVRIGGREVASVLRRPIQADLMDVLGHVEDVASDTDRHGYIDAAGLLVRGFAIS